MTISPELRDLIIKGLRQQQNTLWLLGNASGEIAQQDDVRELIASGQKMIASLLEAITETVPQQDWIDTFVQGVTDMYVKAMEEDKAFFVFPETRPFEREDILFVGRYLN